MPLDQDYIEMLDQQAKWVHETDLKVLRANPEHFIQLMGKQTYEDRVAYAESKVL